MLIKYNFNLSRFRIPNSLLLNSLMLMIHVQVIKNMKWYLPNHTQKKIQFSFSNIYNIDWLILRTANMAFGKCHRRLGEKKSCVSAKKNSFQHYGWSETDSSIWPCGLGKQKPLFILKWNSNICLEIPK